MKVPLTPYVHSWPAPAVLVGCGTLEKPNLIAIAWFGVVCSEPPTVAIAVRPSRFSFNLIQATGEFTINLPRVGDVHSVDYCGNRSGREVDKFNACGLTPVACPPLKSAPMIQEFFISYGCRVKQEIPLGTHTLFIGEIVSMYCEESLVRKSGKANPIPEEQIVWVDKVYWGLRRLGK
jgi:flavin reductase (DIM6/NTAB) family NADH-FMN oxidoreductase RutF